ncbi:MAG TPA: DUF1538 domain-containing protein [Firmicutes bacterium]|jgi:hypothetical protein|nr:DUF1538 domain-containing protein [Bacillota bacterium]
MHKTFKESIRETAQAVLPVSLVVIMLQFLLAGIPLASLLQFLIGTLMVMAGLFLFLTGVKIGLLPLGEMIGSHLPRLGVIALVLIVAFVVGFSVTVAEPDVRVLAYQVDLVSNGAISQTFLVFAVALGVGFFISLGMLRLALNFPIQALLGISYLVILILSFFTPPEFIPVAFDSGGVTTGPLTTPFILALGIGTVSVLGGRSSLANSFGLVGLASAGPIIAVMLLGVFTG